MAKDPTTVILATPLSYPKASKALSNVVTALKPEQRPAFYHTLSTVYKTNGKNATVGDLPEPLQSATVLNWAND